MIGYQSAFLGESYDVPISEDLIQHGQVLHYHHYSVIMDIGRGFPVMTAANIDGSKFLSIPRHEIWGGGSDKWKKDERIHSDGQWGMELYGAPKSDFDRGHMTKREDVQWGDTEEEAAEAARSTFYFTNAVPQHARVNQSIWRKIEDYVLKSQSVKENLKINVFTGPVLADGDPEFVTEVKGQSIKIPTLFWKVIFYIDENQELSRVAFLVGQKYLLEKNGIVRRVYKTKSKRLRFMNFKYADTYQTEVPLIEELSGISFSEARDPMLSSRPTKLAIEEVNVRGHSGEDQKESSIKGLLL